MGVTDFGRGNKAITYRALGVGMKIAFFRGQGTAVTFAQAQVTACAWGKLKYKTNVKIIKKI